MSKLLFDWSTDRPAGEGRHVFAQEPGRPLVRVRYADIDIGTPPQRRARVEQIAALKWERMDVAPGDTMVSEIEIGARDLRVTIHATENGLHVAFAIGPAARHPFDQRTVSIPEHLIAAHMRLPVPIGPHNMESWGRNNLDLIARRAVAQNNAVTTAHLREIDDERPGLVDLIILRGL